MKNSQLVRLAGLVMVTDSLPDSDKLKEAIKALPGAEILQGACQTCKEPSPSSMRKAVLRQWSKLLRDLQATEKRK